MANEDIKKLIEAIGDLVDVLKSVNENERSSAGATPTPTPVQTRSASSSRGGGIFDNLGKTFSGTMQSAVGNIIAQSGASKLPDFVTKFSQKYDSINDQAIGMVAPLWAEAAKAGSPYSDSAKRNMAMRAKTAATHDFNARRDALDILEPKSGIYRGVEFLTGIDIAKGEREITKTVQNAYNGELYSPNMEGTGFAQAMMSSPGSSGGFDMIFRMIGANLWRKATQKNQIQQNQQFHSTD